MDIVNIRGIAFATTALLSTTGVGKADAQVTPTIEAVEPVAEPEAQARPDADIVVTALKRSVSAQDVPASVAIVSGEAIKQASVTSALDLPTITPGVLIQVAPGQQPVAAIRGIGSNASNQSFDQSVALFVDGVFAPRGRDYASSLFDVENVQVIRGGQSAILGKNTTIGAIAMTTRRPDFRFGAEASYTHEFALGSDSVNGALNIPLGDDLAVRVAGTAATLEGWQHNDLTGRDSPRTRSWAGRVKLRWRPTTDLDWNVYYQQERFRQTGQLLYVAGDPLGTAGRLATAAGDARFRAAFDDRFRSSPRPGFPDDFTSNRGKRAVSDISYRFGDGYLLAVLTGYTRTEGAFRTNFNAIASAPVYFSSDAIEGRTLFQEVRLSTPRYGVFDLVGGILYYHDSYRYDFQVDAVAPTPVTGAELTSFKQTTRDWSGFLSTTADLATGLTLNAAVRYTTEDRHADYARTVIRPGGLTAALFRPFTPLRLSRSSDNVDASVALQYAIAPNVMAYASYARGTKGGGFANNPNDPTLRRADGSRAAEFTDEVANTFEAGIKLGRLSAAYLNASVFNIDVDGFQTALFSGATFVVNNIPVRSRGVELQAGWTPVAGLKLSVDATYADAVNKAPAATERARLVRAPEFSGIATVAYRAPLTPGWTLDASANAEFRSRMYFQDLLTSPVPPSGSFARLGLRLAIARPDDGVEIALIGRNLSDRRIANFGTTLFPGVPGAYLYSSEMPRTIALQVSVSR